MAMKLEPATVLHPPRTASGLLVDEIGEAISDHSIDLLRCERLYYY